MKARGIIVIAALLALTCAALRAQEEQAPEAASQPANAQAALTALVASHLAELDAMIKEHGSKLSPEQLATLRMQRQLCADLGAAPKPRPGSKGTREVQISLAPKFWMAHQPGNVAIGAGKGVSSQKEGIAFKDVLGNGLYWQHATALPATWTFTARIRATADQCARMWVGEWGRSGACRIQFTTEWKTIRIEVTKDKVTAVVNGEQVDMGRRPPKVGGHLVLSANGNAIALTDWTLTCYVEE